MVVLRNSCVASMQEVVTPLIANFGKINDLRLHAFETIILRQNANGILSSDSSLVFGELDNNDSDDIVINV